MTLSVKHNYVSAQADAGNPAIVQPSNWNDSHAMTQATGAMLGRVSAGAGVTEELSPAQARALLVAPTYVANIAALQALDTTKDVLAFLTDVIREGVFAWMVGDYSALVAADTLSGVYVKANAIATTSGAWVREFDGPAFPEWWGAQGDDATDDLASINLAVAMFRDVQLSAKIYRVSSAVVMAQPYQKLRGRGPYVTQLKGTSATGAIISVTGSASMEISKLSIVPRTVTANSTAPGIDFGVGQSLPCIEHVEISGQGFGAVLRGCGYGHFRHAYVHQNISGGIYMTPNVSPNRGDLQWILDDILCELNGGAGIQVVATGTGFSITMGDWINIRTYANTGFGLSFAGSAAVPINGVRIRSAFIGEDANSEIYMDTYGSGHIIENVYAELPGRSNTGPTVSTAPSGVGSGMEFTANNTNVDVADCYLTGASDHGLRTLATFTKVTGCQSLNNAKFGMLFGDGTKMQLVGSRFTNNTSGDLSVTANASSRIAIGNSPKAVDNLGQIAATATNDNALAGNVGEYAETVIAIGSAVSLVSGAPKDMITLSLTAGDWDVEYIPNFTGGVTTTLGYLIACLSTVTNTTDLTNGRFVSNFFNNATTFNSIPGNGLGLGSITCRFSLSATTTIRAVVLASFGVSTCSGYGLLRARRVR